MGLMLQDIYNDQLEYVSNLKQLGASEEMATYQVRYYRSTTEKTIKEVIRDLHLEQFATKQDIARLEIATKQDIARLEIATKQDIARLEKEIIRLEKENKEEFASIRTDMHKMKFTLLIWQIGIGIASVTTMYTIMSSMINNLVKSLGH